MIKHLRNTAQQLALLTLLACATQSSPEGGPKDKKAPVLLRSEPQHKQLNFDGKSVQLSFNESITLKNPKEEIIIAPSVGKDVNIRANDRTVTITPKNGWAENTTYTISFREAIQDVTEGNPAPNLRMAFSTGSILDSLSIAGEIKNPITDQIPENITVAVYASDTFNIFKHGAAYFTKTDKKGLFTIENLPPATYHLYAFEDKNKNLKVDSQNELFGFKSDSIALRTKLTRQNILIAKTDARPLKLLSKRAIRELATLRFSKSIIDYKLSSPTKLPNTFGESSGEVLVYLDTLSKDSTKVSIKATDSLNIKLDTTVYLKLATTKRPKEKFNVAFTNVLVKKETGEFQANFQSTKIITEIVTDSLNIQIDSSTYIPITKEDIQLDTIRRKGNIEKKLDLDKIPKASSKLFQLIAKKNFAKSIENDTIKKAQVPIDVKTLENTGTIIIEVLTKSTNAFVIQLLNTDHTIVKEIANMKKVTINYLEPKTYKLRLVVDLNKNHRWDPGNIFQREQPEPTIYYQNPEKKTDIPVRANWEVGPLLLTF